MCFSFALVNKLKVIFILLVLVFWNYTSLAQEITSIKDSLHIDGDVGLRNVLYFNNGQDRRVPFSYVLNANLTISKGEFSVPLSFTYSEQERSFSQPFNQFGLTPTYKWIKTYIGYNSISWNNYTLSGTQFLGGGIELNPKKVRIGAMYGRLRRATPIDSIGYTANQNDLPSYARWVGAGKIGYGTESNFIDLIFLKGKDKIHTHSPILKDSITYVFPAENSSIGIKSQFSLGNNITFLLDGGTSLFTRDLTAKEISSNEGIGENSIIHSLGKVKNSTSIYYGGEAGVNFNVQGHTFGLNTKYITPDYQGMGLYYMDNDVQSYGFNHTFNAWKSKINLSYGINRLKDNLLDKKEVTTIRIQPLISLSFNPSNKWGIETNWNNYYTRQENGLLQLSDSFRMARSNPGLTITPHAQWGDTIKYHSISLVYTNIQLLDNNPYTAIFSQYQAIVYGANYSLSLIPNNVSANMGLNLTQNKNNYTEEQAYGGSVGLNKSTESNKWNIGANLGVQSSNLTNNISLNISGAYNLKNKQSLNFGCTLLNSKQKANFGQNFNEITFTLTYNKQFNHAYKKKK